MKKILYLTLLSIFAFSSCTKHCLNLLDGPINDEEKKYILSSEHTFLYENQFGDTGYIKASNPSYVVLPVTDDDCDRVGNEAMSQTWTLHNGINLGAYFQHDNGLESSRILTLSLGSQAVFQYNIIDPSFITIVINTQRFPNTMIDSTTNSTLSPQIRKIWYGKHTGMLQYEKWNGEVWTRQKLID